MLRALVVASTLVALPALAQPAPRPFPVPSLDGKQLASSPGQTTFRLPMRFAAVERFYRDLYKDDAGVTMRPATKEGRRVLTLVSKRPGDAWGKATLHEREVETLIEVVPVVRVDAAAVTGNASPVFVFIPRSPEAQRQLDSIDHLERDR